MDRSALRHVVALRQSSAVNAWGDRGPKAEEPGTGAGLVPGAKSQDGRGPSRPRLPAAPAEGEAPATSAVPVLVRAGQAGRAAGPGWPPKKAGTPTTA